MNPLSDFCQDYLNRTMQPAVPFTLGDAHDHPHIWQSKIGGNPYLPLNADYPRNANGEPLTLLAQVNFAEMPPLPNFPTSGSLQFFIDGMDYSCGMDFEYQSRENYRVVYHPRLRKIWRSYATILPRFRLPYWKKTRCR